MIEKVAVESFAGVRVVSDVVEIVTTALKKRDFDSKNLLFSTCVCPDEINHSASNISALFAKTYGLMYIKNKAYLF